MPFGSAADLQCCKCKFLIKNHFISWAQRLTAIWVASCWFFFTISHPFLLFHCTLFFVVTSIFITTCFCGLVTAMRDRVPYRLLMFNPKRPTREVCLHVSVYLFDFVSTYGSCQSAVPSASERRQWWGVECLPRTASKGCEVWSAYCRCCRRFVSILLHFAFNLNYAHACKQCSSVACSTHNSRF